MIVRVRFRDTQQRFQPKFLYFPENFRYNLAHYEKEKFFDSSLHHIFESESFRFPFSYEK